MGVRIYSYWFSSLDIGKAKKKSLTIGSPRENEYFDARKGKSNIGYGGKNFSWTAALLIDN